MDVASGQTDCARQYMQAVNDGRRGASVCRLDLREVLRHVFDRVEVIRRAHPRLGDAGDDAHAGKLVAEHRGVAAELVIDLRTIHRIPTEFGVGHQRHHQPWKVLDDVRMPRKWLTAERIAHDLSLGIAEKELLLDDAHSLLIRIDRQSLVLGGKEGIAQPLVPIERPALGFRQVIARLLRIGIQIVQHPPLGGERTVEVGLVAFRIFAAGTVDPSIERASRCECPDLCLRRYRGHRVGG
jgi:hypothetical protein